MSSGNISQIASLVGDLSSLVTSELVASSAILAAELERLTALQRLGPALSLAQANSVRDAIAPLQRVTNLVKIAAADGQPSTAGSAEPIVDPSVEEQVVEESTVVAIDAPRVRGGKRHAVA